MVKVAIVIVNWNNIKDTIDCLNSIAKSEINFNFLVIVVDNASVEPIDKLSTTEWNFPTYIIRNSCNYGFAGGSNRGIDYALSLGVDYIVLLNNDTVVKKRSLQKLIEVMENDKMIGIAGPVIFYYNEPDKIWHFGAKINLHSGAVKSLLRSYEIVKKNSSGLLEVDYVPGTCLVIRAELVSLIGNMDEKYFCYWEEVDWAIRVKKLNYKIVCALDIKLLHKVSKSTPNIIHFYFFFRNQLYFFKKYSHPCFFYFIQIRVILKAFSKVVILLIQGKCKEALSIVLGIQDFYRRRLGCGRLSYLLARIVYKYSK